MIVECPQCQTKYQFDMKKLEGRQEAQLRCAKCQAVFAVRNPPPAASAGRTAAEATIASKTGGALPEDKMVSLVVTSGPLKGKVFPVSKARMVLGRTGTDIVLEDSEVSRQHCAIEFHGSIGLLVDLGSSNGTFVGNER